MDPRRVAPYFWLAALVHAVSLATRFDLLAARIPAGVQLGIMIAQFPLLMLSGFFEGQLRYEDSKPPLWMRLPRPVRLAFAFGFTYLTCVAFQTWKLSIGPLNPLPPPELAPAMRVFWFAMFGFLGSFFFVLAASSTLIPLLRVVTWPLRQLPHAIGAVLALVIGGALGVGVLSLVTSSKLGAFIAGVQATIEHDPALLIAVTLGCVLVPLVVGLLLDRE